MRGSLTTKDKNLNSEIETLTRPAIAPCHRVLRKTRISILRLKLTVQEPKLTNPDSTKDKNLNSEIETNSFGPSFLPSFSTTKDKNLNSEIETITAVRREKGKLFATKDKNLNSEIETFRQRSR